MVYDDPAPARESGNIRNTGRREELGAQRRDLRMVSSAESAELSWSFFVSLFVADCNLGRGETGAEQRGAERWVLWCQLFDKSWWILERLYSGRSALRLSSSSLSLVAIACRYRLSLSLVAIACRYRLSLSLVAIACRYRLSLSLACPPHEGVFGPRVVQQIAIARLSAAGKRIRSTGGSSEASTGGQCRVAWRLCRPPRGIAPSLPSSLIVQSSYRLGLPSSYPRPDHRRSTHSRSLSLTYPPQKGVPGTWAVQPDGIGVASVKCCGPIYVRHGASP